MRKTEPIKVINQKSDTSLFQVVETHPAFVQASFSRRQGHPGKLYGSNLDHHHTHVTLEVKRSELVHDLSRDWHFSKELLIEVDFSAAQFAELITTMNVGSGVPCTLRFNSKEGKIPGLPEDTSTESERIEESFNANLAEKVKRFEEYEKQIAEILKKKSIGKADREQIKSMVYQARRFFIDSAPFAATSLVEVKEKLVSSAKAEIEASLMDMITKTGIQTLKGKSYESFRDDNDADGFKLPSKS